METSEHYVQTSFNILRNLKAALRIYCAENDTTQTRVINNCLAALLQNEVRKLQVSKPPTEVKPEFKL